MPRRRGQEGLGVGDLLGRGDGQKSCGACSHFSASSGPGICDVLKSGSDITSNQPLFILQGLANFQTDGGVDASRCRYYEGKDKFSPTCM